MTNLVIESNEMIKAKGWAVYDKTGEFHLIEFERRQLQANDVLIRIQYCGICHSDIHEVNSDWGASMYPLIPGHEIIGLVEKLGHNVQRFSIGDTVGVGCLVDSCRKCQPCQMNLEQYCFMGASYTYNSHEMDKNTKTYGGYSNIIIVVEHFVFKIPKNLPLDGVAPLLCSGITTYSVLNRYHINENSRIGIVGLGGLGHIAVKLAVAMKAHVIVIGLYQSQAIEAQRLGAQEFVLSNDRNKLELFDNSLNLIIDTVPNVHDIDSLLQLLKFQAVFCMVGLSPKPLEFSPVILAMKQITICGTLIGGVRETQEMLDFCGEHKISSDIELISPSNQSIRSAYQRILQGDVKYRFVLDLRNEFK